VTSCRGYGWEKEREREGKSRAGCACESCSLARLLVLALASSLDSSAKDSESRQRASQRGGRASSGAPSRTSIRRRGRRWTCRREDRASPTSLSSRCEALVRLGTRHTVELSQGDGPPEALQCVWEKVGRPDWTSLWPIVVRKAALDTRSRARCDALCRSSCSINRRCQSRARSHGPSLLCRPLPPPTHPAPPTRSCPPLLARA